MVLLCLGSVAQAAPVSVYLNHAVATDDPVARYTCLVQAYPDYLSHVDNNELIWKDGTRMIIDHGRRFASHDEWLDNACLRDQLLQCYPSASLRSPSLNEDPGRARYEPFFLKMYGETKAKVQSNLKTIVWMPGVFDKKLQVTSVNGVADKLSAISAELVKLPKALHRYLKNPGGTFNWRNIAGTKRMSTHSFGITIDINVAESHYWRNAKPDRSGLYAYKNAIPQDIVAIFEKHGFVWGGKWYHYDTMHFEYRPELLQAPCRCSE